jgi:Fe-S cluster biogenesis protein NfuA/nitrite reductase/ring-hydroxylating ferredoxin subunit
VTITERHERTLPADVSFEELAERVDAARVAVDKLDPAGRKAAEELQLAIEGFHRQALVTMVRTLKGDERGKQLLFDLVDDPGVHAVLALHGIIRPSLMIRANQTLDSVRPYLESHGGGVELVDVRDGIAFVRLQGSCNGCSMSAITLREGVEEALLKGVPEITGVEVMPNEPTEAFIPLGSVGRKPTDTGWIEGPDAADVVDGSLLRVDVGEESFVVTNIGNRYAVFRNECVHQGMTLDGGMIEDGVLQCPWHGFRFDASSGECLSAPGAQLQQVPLRLENGRVWIRAH